MQHGKNGLLFEPEGLDALIDRVRQLIANRGLARSMGLARRTFAENVDWGRIFDHLLIYYQEVIDEKRAARPGIYPVRVGVPTTAKQMFYIWPR